MAKLCWVTLCLSVLSTGVLSKPVSPGQPFLINVDNETAIIGNDIWNVTVGRQYAKKLFYKGVDLVGNATGHYVSYNGAQSDLNLTNAYVYKKTGEYTDIAFVAKEGEFHWVLTPTLAGAYQYFVNKALPTLGEFRTLWRLDNDTFTHGKTDERDEALPPVADILAATNVQDETWQRADGSFITKYDFSTFMPTIEGQSSYWGVHGTLKNSTGAKAAGVGSWYIHGGKDYLNGDHLKQELMVHRESRTGDTVQLNMIHGTHFQALSSDVFPAGKTWGPWLWYLNDGSIADVESRSKKETAAWPYKWFDDSYGFQSRGKLSGRIVLSDGRPAAGAAIFLGDNHANLTSLDQGKWYYYRTYADRDGKFELDNVRAGTWGLQAWPNGGKIGDVTTVFQLNDVSITPKKTTRLEKLQWKTQGRKLLWQIGQIDRRATGFGYSGPPHEHARVAKCQPDLTYTIGESSTATWCFGQSALGTYTVSFQVPHQSARNISAATAVLSVSLAGHSRGTSGVILLNDVAVGNLTTANIPTDPSVYRSGTLAGEWHYFEFPIAAGLLAEGSNTVKFQVTKSTLWRGWIFDSVLLEWL